MTMHFKDEYIVRSEVAIQAMVAANVSLIANAVSARVVRKKQSFASLWPFDGPVASADLLHAIVHFRAQSIPGKCLLLSSGGGNFALQMSRTFASLKVVLSDGQIVDSMKKFALETAAAPQDEKEEKSTLASEHADICFGSLLATDLPDGSFDLVIIEDTGLPDLPAVHGEAMRVLSEVGVLIHLRYLPFIVLAAGANEKEVARAEGVNRCLVDGVSDIVVPVMNGAEHELMAACLKSLPRLQTSTVQMEAKCSLKAMVVQLESWTAVRRLQAAGAADAIELWHFYRALRDVWANPKKERRSTGRLISAHGVSRSRVERYRSRWERKP